MDLNRLVAGLIGVVNPSIKVTITPSTGYVTNADGTRTPSYGTPFVRSAQMQPLQYNDIVQADALNIQGKRVKFYIAGDYEAIVRVDGKGGDLITTPDGKVWLVAIQAEEWLGPTGWSAVICTLQDGS